MKRSALTLIFFTVTLAVAQHNKPVQSLSYSGIDLKLGDQEQSTIQELRRQFTVNRVDRVDVKTANATEYLVTRQKPSTDILGVITFRGGKLVKAYRDWTPDDTSAYAFVVALKGAIEAIKNDGPCTLDTGSVQEPNYLNQSSSVICGNKYIQATAIESSQLNNKTIVSIFEWLDDFSKN